MGSINSNAKATNYIRILYLVPADSSVKPEYITALENTARHLQVWYYHALGLKRTFTLHDPIVEVYHTSHNMIWYSTHPNGSDYYWNNVIDEGIALTGRSSYDPNNIWVHYIDANPACEGQCGGCGTTGLVVISANDLKGLAGYQIDTSCPNVWRIYPPCRYVGGLGHELGHAFGLSHPPPCDESFPTCWDKDLMMFGYTTYPDAYLNEADKNRLKYNIFFTNLDIEGVYYPGNCDELTNNCSYNRQTEVSMVYGDSIFLEGRYRNIPGTYYDTLYSDGNCDTVLITHLNIIVPPVNAEDVAICEGDIPILTAEGENIKWYSDKINPVTALHDSRNGQTYNIVRIGNQVWMAENLNYYTSSGSWYYNYDSISYAETYGRLYDWETAQNVCPAGWHLSWYLDWSELIDYLGDSQTAGGKIKETGYDHWDPPNTGATNITGFTALPAGKKDFEGGFYHMGYYAKFWTPAQFDEGWGRTFEVRSDSERLFGGTTSNQTAFSVRCVMDANSITGTGNTFISGYDSPGTYIYYVTQTVFGIESPMEPVVLTINENYTGCLPKDTCICNGDSIAVGSNYYSNTGIYHDTLKTVHGCDSIVITQITVYPKYETNQTTEICHGESILLSGQLQTQPGIYYDTLQTVHGCDSVIITELSVYPAYEINQTAEICEGDSILLGGQSRTQPGSYFDTLQSIRKCDSVIITELVVNTLPDVYLGSDTIITTNDTIILDVGSGFVDYLWNDGSDDQIKMLHNLSTGDHEISVRVKNVDNCSNSDTIRIHVVLPDLLSNDFILHEIDIFPNPTLDFLVIKPKKHIESDLIVTLLDNSGRVVNTGILERPDANNEVIIDLSGLNSGFYILCINSDELLIIKKIIKN